MGIALGVWHVPYAGAAASAGEVAAFPGVALPADVFAPTVTAGAAATVRLGAPFTLFVTAVTHAETPVNLVEPVQLGAGFEIRRRVQRDRLLADGRRERQWQFEVWAWQLGSQQMAPIALSYLAGATLASVRTAPVAIEVTGVFGNVDAPPALAPALPPRPLWVPWWTPLWGSIAVAVLLGLVGWGLRRWRHRRRLRAGLRLGAPQPTAYASGADAAVHSLQRALRAVVGAAQAPAEPRRTAQAMLHVLTQFLDAADASQPALQTYARGLSAARAQMQLASYGEVVLTHAHCVALCEAVCATLASESARDDGQLGPGRQAPVVSPSTDALPASDASPRTDASHAAHHGALSPASDAASTPAPAVEPASTPTPEVVP